MITRDPASAVVKNKGVVYRCLSSDYIPHYNQLMGGGLYERLVADGLLIQHKQVDGGTILPEYVQFISYPWEWCFSQLKAAARATLAIQRTSLDYGMTLKDATPLNIQFKDGKPVLIDTSSFEIYQEGKPWQAYTQYCESFLAPLCIASRNGDAMLKLTSFYTRGIPLSIAGDMLPLSCLVNERGIHIKAQSMMQSKSAKRADVFIPKKNMYRVIDSLERSIDSVKPKHKKGWNDYPSLHNYSDIAYDNKRYLVNWCLSLLPDSTLLDVGCNNGGFTILAKNQRVIGVDSEYACIEHCYTSYRDRFMPLVVDIANPTPATGFYNVEHDSFIRRAKFTTVMALALIHHLVISASIPVDVCLTMFAGMGKYLLIEFPTPDDTQVKGMMDCKTTSQPYSLELFESELSHRYNIVARSNIADSARVLYLCQRK